MSPITVLLYRQCQYRLFEFDHDISRVTSYSKIVNFKALKWEQECVPFFNYLTLEDVKYNQMHL